MKSEGPLPEPRGSLPPPVRHPPTAVGLATPPPPAPIPSVSGRRPRGSPLVRFLRRLAMIPLDLADGLVDRLLGPKAGSG
jgi:hypothetical protein